MARYDNDRVRAALRAVFRPLADLMISSGITLTSATELMKQVLFDEAQRRFDGPVSDSQISLLTGLHRKDVRRFREAGAEPERASFAPASARLIARWASDARYLEAGGRPRPLPRAAEAGPSFDGLVRDLRLDIAPGTILQHLLTTGHMATREDGSLVLRADAYLPLAGSAEMLAAFEKNILAHLQAAVDNLTEDAPPHFERASHFNKLSKASAEALETLARRLAEEQLAAFNAEAHRLQQRDKGGADTTQRVSFGGYVIAQDQSPRGNTQ
ncbi:MAG: DUF6502 family protein [Pseudomonadota bacterium]